MNDRQKAILLKVARESVAAAVSGRKAPETATDDAELNSPCGCFVTLKNAGQLRGCIGRFVADEPLIQTVAEMAVAAAVKDARFFDNPVTEEEIPQLDIEISVLSPLKKTDDPLSLRLGVDGIYIRKGFASGCFLPQVAAETGWSREEFLSYCCSSKAGLDPTAWKDADTEVYLFTAEIIEEKKN